jgi:hypothetical protein
MTERRPRITRIASFRQAAVLVLDGSPSMEELVAPPSQQLTDDVPNGSGATKGQAVGGAVAGLIERLNKSGNAANYSVGGVVFSQRVERRWVPIAVGNMQPQWNFDPTVGSGDGTSIAAGLEAAEELVQAYLRQGADGLPSSTIVLVCSDGECAEPQATREVARRLKSDPRVKIACAFFATRGRTPNGLPLMSEICSEPAAQFCTMVYDPETLRRFWEATLRASSPGAQRAPMPAIAAGQRLP